MRRVAFLAVALGASFELQATDVVLQSAPAKAKVELQANFQLADNSVDSLLRGKESESFRRALERELNSLSSKCLGKEQVIELSLLEAKLSGAVGSSRRAPREDLRMVKNSWVAWIHFDYRLFDADKLVAQGSKKLHGSGFVADDPAARNQSSGYVTERRLLANWFSDEFCRSVPTESR